MHPYRGRTLAAVIAAIVLAAALVYAASLYVPVTPVNLHEPSATLVKISPAGVATSLGVGEGAVEAGASPGITVGVVSPSVEKLLAELSRMQAERVRGSVTVTGLTVTEVVEVRGLAERAARVASPSTGTTVAVEGVDELDTVKLVEGILYVARGGLVYRVNVSTGEPLEPLNPVADARRLWGEARVYIELPQGERLNRTIRASIGLRGLLYTGNALAAFVTVTYGYTPWMPGGTWTGVIVYRGSRPVCRLLLPGALIDARGADGLVWLEARIGQRVYRILSKGYLETWKPKLIVAVVNVTSCKASMLELNETPSWRQPLLLVAPGARRAYLAFSVWSGVEGWTTMVTLLTYNGTLYAVNATLLPGLIPSNWLAAIYANESILLILERMGGGFTLYTLNPNSLAPEAKLDIPRPRERVHAILYLHGYLYIVTYRNIDPLFAINVTDPRHPQLLGWRKGPGYDQILWPLQDNIIIGIGYTDNRNLRLSTYRLQADASLTPIDRLVLKDYTAPLLSKTGAYRYLAITYDTVAYPVLSCRGPCSQEVLAAKIDPKGKITMYKLVKGYRAVSNDTQLYVIGDREVLVFDTSVFRVVKAIPLSKR